MKFSAIYCIFVGIMMVLQWGLFLAAGKIPEMQTEPLRIAFHLVAEFITALGLIISGAALLRQRSWGVPATLVFSGMLLYSVIASPGYFAQQGQWIFTLMFAVLLGLALVSIWLAARSCQAVLKEGT